MNNSNSSLDAARLDSELLRTFLAVARDATAAYSNPAGLTFLSDPELSIELRDWEFTNSNYDRGHGFGDPSGIGRDTVPGLVEKKSLPRNTSAT